MYAVAIPISRDPFDDSPSVSAWALATVLPLGSSAGSRPPSGLKQKVDAWVAAPAAIVTELRRAAGDPQRRRGRRTSGGTPNTCARCSRAASPRSSSRRRGNPLVYGELQCPARPGRCCSTRHYDGQPVDPQGWKQPIPFTPVLRAGRWTTAAPRSRPRDAARRSTPTGASTRARHPTTRRRSSRCSPRSTR